MDEENEFGEEFGHTEEGMDHWGEKEERYWEVLGNIDQGQRNS